MKLHAWETENGRTVRPFTTDEGTGAMLCGSIPEIFDNLEDRRGLFHLSDFAVSSVTGGSIWLVRRGSFPGTSR
jgi:hypothetical protein